MIFNGEMVRAILDGGKTQTRRPVKVPHIDRDAMCELSGNELAGELSAGNYRNSPHGKPGDRIWVRETWNKYGGLLTYRADYDWIEDMKKEMACHESYPKWHPSIHMPRWASRITLEITGVRVERLRDLSEDDAKSEGITPPSGGVLPGWEYRINFRDLWMSIYGADNWEANPWVWVIEFKVVPNVQDNPA